MLIFTKPLRLDLSAVKGTSVISVIKDTHHKYKDPSSSLTSWSEARPRPQPVLLPVALPCAEPPGYRTFEAARPGRGCAQDSRW